MGKLWSEMETPLFDNQKKKGGGGGICLRRSRTRRPGTKKRLPSWYRAMSKAHVDAPAPPLRASSREIGIFLHKAETSRAARAFAAPRGP